VLCAAVSFRLAKPQGLDRWRRGNKPIAVYAEPGVILLRLNAPFGQTHEAFVGHSEKVDIVFLFMQPLAKRRKLKLNAVSTGPLPGPNLETVGRFRLPATYFNPVSFRKPQIVTEVRLWGGDNVAGHDEMVTQQRLEDLLLLLVVELSAAEWYLVPVLLACSHCLFSRTRDFGPILSRLLNRRN
jgi:hypothetical protein